MTTALLIVAVVTGAVAVAVGFPAWRSWQARVAVNRNAERYLAWRGRADRSAPDGERMTSGERQRIGAGIALAVVAIGCLIIGLTTG